MALSKIDFSAVQRLNQRSFNTMQNYDPMGDAGDGMLQGMQMAQNFQKQKMDRENHEINKEMSERKGTLMDLEMEKLRGDIEDLPEKREYEKDIRKLKLDEAETNVERAKVNLEFEKNRANKAAKEASGLPNMTARSYEEAGLLTSNLIQAIEGAPDQESQSLMIDRANNIIKNHKTLSVLFPDGVSADERGIELLRYQSELFTEQANEMMTNQTWIDEKTGDMMGYDKDGNPKLIKTYDQLKKNMYRPTPVKSGTDVKNNRRAVGATMDKLFKDQGIEVEIPGLSSRQIQDRVTQQYLGVLAERKAKNMEPLTMEEAVDEAFDLAFPENKFVLQGEEDGVKKYLFDPAAAIQKGNITFNGQSQPISVIEFSGDNVLIMDESTGKKYRIPRKTFDSTFKAQKQ